MQGTILLKLSPHRMRPYGIRLMYYTISITFVKEIIVLIYLDLFINLNVEFIDNIIYMTFPVQFIVDKKTF